jgi:hypothetical protein
MRRNGRVGALVPVWWILARVVNMVDQVKPTCSRVPVIVWKASTHAVKICTFDSGISPTPGSEQRRGFPVTITTW